MTISSSQKNEWPVNIRKEAAESGGKLGTSEFVAHVHCQLV